MDENRVEGTARNVKGKIQEGIGSLAGNARMRAEGLANQAGGAAQDLYISHSVVTSEPSGLRELDDALR